MSRIWTFFHNKTNREIISWIASVITVVAGASWTLFVYFDQSNSTKKNELNENQLKGCWRLPEYVKFYENTPALRELLKNDLLRRTHHLYNRLKNAKLVYGWKGGAAGKLNPNQAVNFPITSVLMDGESMFIHYAWQNGKMQIRASLPDCVSCDVTGLFKGIWVQDNGLGCVALNFEESQVSANGWWSRAGKNSTKHPSFIKSAK